MAFGSAEEGGLQDVGSAREKLAREGPIKAHAGGEIGREGAALVCYTHEALHCMCYRTVHSHAGVAVTSSSMLSVMLVKPPPRACERPIPMLSKHTLPDQANMRMRRAISGNFSSRRAWQLHSRLSALRAASSARSAAAASAPAGQWMRARLGQMRRVAAGTSSSQRPARRQRQKQMQTDQRCLFRKPRGGRTMQAGQGRMRSRKRRRVVMRFSPSIDEVSCFGAV